MAQKENDFQKISKLIEIMKANALAEIEIKHGDDRILLKRFGPQQQPVIGVASPAPAVPPPNCTTTVQNISPEAAGIAGRQSNLVEIKSPIVGTFYAKPSPDSPPYVEVGSHVTEQTVVCVIEAMKVMNEIKAEVSGPIVEVLITNGQAVEYGQVIFRVKPD